MYEIVPIRIIVISKLSLDPFAPSKDEKSSGLTSSGFPGVPLPMPTMLSTSNMSSQNNAQNITSQPPVAKKASNEFKADFANFDAANFGDTNRKYFSFVVFNSL